MILQNQMGDFVQQLLALFRRHIVDFFNVCADGKDAFPAGNRMCADHGVHSCQAIADVFGRAARAHEDGGAASSGGNIELGLGIGCGKGLQESLVWLGEAVINFVAGGPESIFWMLTYGTRPCVARQSRQ